MINDLVSIIIPVYNREKLVRFALNSLLEQTYKNIEIIVVNDGSEDNTLDVLREYEKKHPEIVKVVNQENTGQVIARNNGIKKSKGQYIAFLDSDDTWLPEKLEKQMPLFKSDVGLVYCGINEVNADGSVIKKVLCEKGMRGNIFNHLLVRNRMTGGTVVVTRDAIDKVGLFDEKLRAAENWDLWTRISKYFLVDYVDEALVNYMKHEGNMSLNPILMLEATKALLEKNLKDEPDYPVLKESYNNAYAYYYYGWGLYYQNQEDYPDARKNYRRSIEFVDGFLDVRQRIFRTYLGRHINRFLSKMRKII